MRSVLHAAFGFPHVASKAFVSENAKISLLAEEIGEDVNRCRAILEEQFSEQCIANASVCYNIDSNGVLSVNLLELTEKKNNKKSDKAIGRLGRVIHDAVSNLLDSLNRSQATAIARGGVSNFDAPGANGRILFHQNGVIDAICERPKKIASQSETIQDLGSLRSSARVQVEYLSDAIESRGFDRIRFEYGAAKSSLSIYVGAPDEPMRPLDAGRHSMFEPICRAYLEATHPESLAQDGSSGRVMIDLMTHKLRHQRQDVRVTKDALSIRIDAGAHQLVEQQSSSPWGEDDSVAQTLAVRRPVSGSRQRA